MRRSPPPRLQRISVLTLVVSLHVAVIVLLILAGGSPPTIAAKAGTTSAIMVDADKPAERPPPPPPLPSKLVAEIKRLSEQPAAEIDPDSLALAATPGQCATLDSVSKAIIASPAAVAAALNAPPETRSVAEAIVMWNAQWSFAASTPESPLAPARAVVEESLGSIEEGCLDEAIAGPRLVPVPVGDGQRTIFLVFGSGTWTWRDLLADALPPPNEAPDEAKSKKSWFDWF